jgi:hypothetical protein
MAAKLSIHYDAVGDILMIDTVEPYEEQDSDDLGGEIVARFHPVTGAIENLEVLFFLNRVRGGERIELPIDALLRPTGARPEARANVKARPKRGGP